MKLVHRVHTSASPAQVWELLGSPERWPSFDLMLHRVRGASGRAVAGQHLLGISRGMALRIPVDVVESLAEQRLRLVVRTVPGVTQEETFELTPAVRGGCDVSVSVVVDGVFARAAVLPVWLASGVTARLLVAQAERLARSRRRSRGVA